jgi:processive 1,2-diacylglycerol beta-glucosyltransferase
MPAGMKSPPRILVLSASVGAGHLRAAEAVELALRETRPDAFVKNVDCLELTNAAFRRVYGKGYLDLVNRAPHVLGYFYEMMDRPRRPGSVRDKLRHAVDKLNLGKFTRLLRDETWDLVINTHFLPAELIASMRRAGKLSLPHVTVTTDFETHRLWVNQPCDHYFTATEEGAAYLRSWGVPANDITVTGIPILPVFSKSPDRHECLTHHSLAGDRPIVLQSAGGFGVGPIEALYRALLAVPTPIELVVVAGRNEAVRKKLKAVAPPRRHRTHVLGFTDRMHELMAAADLVVSKPGGLTTSEALARGAAMVVVNPIPGQETRNSDFLLENGAAIKVNNLGVLSWKVDELLRDSARLARLKANATRIGRPRAAYDVVERSLRLLR